MFVVGLRLVVGGVVLEWALRRAFPAATTAVVFLASGLAVFGFPPVCDVETRYACASVTADEDDPSRRSLHLDTLHHARVDVDDPTRLDIRYIRLFADVAASLPTGPLDVLHIGGGGFTIPTHLAAVRPGTRSHVIEIDPGVVEIAEDQLGLRPRSEEHTSELQSLMRISYAVFCLKKNKTTHKLNITIKNRH